MKNEQMNRKNLTQKTDKRDGRAKRVKNDRRKEVKDKRG